MGKEETAMLEMREEHLCHPKFALHFPMIRTGSRRLLQAGTHIRPTSNVRPQRKKE